MWRKKLWWWVTLPVTQQYRLASMAAWLSSAGISHHSFLPHILSICLSAVNTSPRLEIAPQSLNSGFQLLHLPGDLVPVWGMYGCGKDCLPLIPFGLPQISCFTRSLKCFSSGWDNCPSGGIGPLLQFPHLQRAGPVLLTLLFSPYSFALPSFPCVYIFFLVGQILLFALNSCSACTSVSEGVFLMYPWRNVLHIHLLLCHLVLSLFFKEGIITLTSWCFLDVKLCRIVYVLPIELFLS